jgi:hypothetical protein
MLAIRKGIEEHCTGYEGIRKGVYEKKNLFVSIRG